MWMRSVDINALGSVHVGWAGKMRSGLDHGKEQISMLSKAAVGEASIDQAGSGVLVFQEGLNSKFI